MERLADGGEAPIHAYKPQRGTDYWLAWQDTKMGIGWGEYGGGGGGGGGGFGGGMTQSDYLSTYAGLKIRLSDYGSGRTHGFNSFGEFGYWTKVWRGYTGAELEADGITLRGVTVMPDKKIWVSLAQSGGGSNWATATLGFIAADISILEPTDAAWPKWVGYAIAASVAAAYLHYAGKGNANYPGPWSYTYQHHSQNPIHYPSNGFDPKETPPGLGTAANWLIGGRLLYEMYDEYQQRMNQIGVQPYVAPRDNTNVVQPQFNPYRQRYKK